MNKLKEKGITLLALIVTVIILLILVGVTIGQITGNKGLFNRVRKTVAQYENSQEQENAEMLELETMLAEERENSKELEEPTANPGDVLLGRSYYDKNKEPQEGTMPNQGSLNRTVPESGKLELNAGYYSGGTITASKSKIGNKIEVVEASAVYNFSNIGPYDQSTKGVATLKFNNSYTQEDYAYLNISGWNCGSVHYWFEDGGPFIVGDTKVVNFGCTWNNTITGNFWYEVCKFVD